MDKDVGGGDDESVWSLRRVEREYLAPSSSITLTSSPSCTSKDNSSHCRSNLLTPTWGLVCLELFLKGM